MSVPTFTMRQLLEAGVHFGHQTHRWNPKMDQYIFGVRNKVHIIDLSITVPLLYRALDEVRKVVANGGRVLFVGTKRQAAEPLAEAARRSGQHFVNHRWLGGMLTNWETISHSIKRLKSLDEQLSGELSGLTKKEILDMTRQKEKLERALGGIKDMGGRPDLMVVIDTNKEEIAIQEANKLGIPVIAILDTNCDPKGITYPVPGNDDASRAIQLYCNLLATAVLAGLQEELGSSGVDTGAAEQPVTEELPAEAPAEELPAETPAEELPAETPAEDGPAETPAEEANKAPESA